MIRPRLLALTAAAFALGAAATASAPSDREIVDTIDAVAAGPDRIRSASTAARSSGSSPRRRAMITADAIVAGNGPDSPGTAATIVALSTSRAASDSFSIAPPRIGARWR